MIHEDMFLLVFQRLALEFLLDFLYFPLWWYTAGAKRALLFCVSLIQDGNMYFAPGLWLKNIFVPMYAQRDWQGRLVSFFMRLVNVIGRVIALLIWTCVVAVLWFGWLTLPVFVLFMLVRSVA